MATFLSIDPSTTRLGWASFDSEKESFDSLVSPAWNFGTLSPPRGDHVEKLYRIREFFHQIQPPDHLVYEMPSFFADTRGAIAAREGHTINLGVVVGIAIGRFPPQTRIWPYTPQKWKGSVSKEITHARLHRAFKDADNYKMNHDVVDAIMLLRFHLIQHDVIKVNNLT
jgi:hypothetical protein